jgi:hypothetical protein
MRTRWLTAAMLAAASALHASALDAQDGGRTPTREIRPFVGAYVPVGAMRRDFRDATMLGLQAAIERSRNLHFVGGASWTHGHNRYDRGSDRTDIWQYDVGLELNLYRPTAAGWVFRPFAGVGGGARTLDYRASGLASYTCTSGYGSLGTELQTGAVALRFEARDYMACFKSPVTGLHDTRSDLGLSLGVAYHRQ